MECQQDMEFRQQLAQKGCMKGTTLECHRKLHQGATASPRQKPLREIGGDTLPPWCQLELCPALMPEWMAKESSPVVVHPHGGAPLLSARGEGQ